MKKNYNTEQEVLNELNINSFSEVTSKEEKKLSSIMAYVKDDIVPTIISKLPNANVFCINVIEKLYEFGTDLVNQSNDVYVNTIKPLNIALEDLKNKSQQRPLTDEEIKYMIEIGKKLADAAKEKRNFMLKVLGGIGAFSLLAVGIIFGADVLKTKISK